MNAGAEVAKEIQHYPTGKLSTNDSVDSNTLAYQPGKQDLLYISGLVAYRNGHYEKAEKIILYAIQAGRQKPCYYNLLGSVFMETGRTSDAAQYYRKAIEIEHEYVEAYFNLGRLYFKTGKCEKSIGCFKRCIQLRPEYHDAYFNLGIVFHKQGLIPDAIFCYQEAIKLQPDVAQSYFSLGSVFHQQGRLEKAIYCYKRAIELNPDFFIAYNSMGIALQKLNRFDEAVSCYKKALDINPNYAGTYVNMGNFYFVNNMFGRAMEWYKNAAKIEPNNSFIYFNMGNTLFSMGKQDEAQKRYEKALELNPDCGKSCARLVEIMQSSCDWSDHDALSHKLDLLTQPAPDRNERIGEYPFLNLVRHSDPALNHAVAKSWSTHLLKEVFKTREKYTHSGRIRHKEKIRIGYLSNNFRNHPSAQLILGLFEKHNRDSFDIFCYSYGKDDGSYYRKHIQKTCDKFVDLRNLNDKEASKRIYLDESDILVDLVGQTEGNRLGICAVRPAPIQVRYLGMAGTTGAGCFDYIITDRIVTPEAHARFYSEKFVFMPHCYQINSKRMTSSRKEFTRRKFGLPEKNFVFCCFNSSYKIDPIIFDVWMNILKRVSGSVLWLMKGSEKVVSNLTNEAEKRGVSGNRLVFSHKLPIKDHLARLQLADLALDTRIVNGAATTSDALWAGIPVITITGGHFASRMSSSILSAVGLQELITDNLKAYEEMAVYLSLNPSALNEMQSKLEQNSKIMPLFDTDRFVGNIETAYRKMYGNYLAGNEPSQIDVVEQ